MRSYVVLGLLSLCLACGQSSAPKENNNAPEAETKEPAAPAPEAAATAKPAGPVEIDLLAKGVEPRNEDNPKMTLTLSVREPGKPEQQIELITVGGGCNRVTGEEGEPGALVAQRCWWAGAGDTVSVHKDGDTLVIRHQEADEAAEEPLPVKELKRVPLPAGASVATP